MFEEIKTALAGTAALVIGYTMWTGSLRQRNLIRATATSRIATAATGFVELTGIVHAVEGHTIHDPIQGVRCLWFFVITERRHKGRWKTVDTKTAALQFALEDDSGACLVMAAQAEVDRAKPDFIVKEGWNRRHRIWRIEEGHALYALGHIDHAASLVQAGSAAATEARAASLIREWKRDQPALLARFDANRDGRIDLDEWQEARRAAHSRAHEVQSKADAAQAPAVLPSGRAITHVLRRPSDGRPLLISRRSEEELARAKLWKSFLGVALFVLGVAALLVTLKQWVGG